MSINLALFRAEAKTEDERHFNCKNAGIEVAVSRGETYPFTVILVRDGEREFREPLNYGHLALATLISEYDFLTILDVGSAQGTAARAFKFLGKEMTTVDIADAFAADYAKDYLEIDFGQQFDAIWCSHVLEYQRYPGRFLDKLFSDLKEDGVLAITVPSALSPLIIGHCNIYTPLLLIYNLVLAGFNCSEARVKCYDWQFSILVRKTSNAIARISVASTRIIPSGYPSPTVPELFEYFPRGIAGGFSSAEHVWGEVDAINWGTELPQRRT